jgi:hypothetical protein
VPVIYNLSLLHVRWRVFLSIAAAGWLLCLPAIVFGASSGAISQSFTATTDDITAGSILSLEPGSNTIVEPSNSTTNAATLEGIAADKPLVELSNNQQNAVQVVTGGVTPVLVSNINGAITAGDRIAPSPLSGIGMKATTPGDIVGTAQTSLSSTKTVTKMITDKSGKRIAVMVGMVPVSVNVSYYSTPPNNSSIAAYIPPFVQTFANRVAGGKIVSSLRVFIATMWLVLGFITASLILYTSVRSGITSLVRNPLAKTALLHGLIDVIVATLGVLLATTVVVYVIVAK